MKNIRKFVDVLIFEWIRGKSVSAADQGAVTSGINAAESGIRQLFWSSQSDGTVSATTRVRMGHAWHGGYLSMPSRNASDTTS